MQTKFDQLKIILGEVADIRSAASVLEWDQDVNMPPGGEEGRSNQWALLKRLAHEKFTSDGVGELLEIVWPEVEALGPDSDAARLVRVTGRLFNRERRVPPDFVVEQSRTTSVAKAVWERAKANADFAMFQPHLEHIVALTRQYAQFFAPYDHVYDPLLEKYEPGIRAREVRAIFDALRPRQVALIQAISQRPLVDDAFLYQPFDDRKQWDFGVQVITQFGYDWQRGRQDQSAHPFTISFGLGDVRITTRVMPDFFNSAFFATLHECGHALYDQGINQALERTPLEYELSMIIHESQSRLWENLVGRSLPFWELYYPKAQAYFPTQLGAVELETFYKGVNKVEPSLIRVEADEATYNLHIMLRFEIEIALLEGRMEVKDLPDAWNERMQAYLGLTPPDDSQGVLQDIHWASDYFGYFPTYALGNLVSLQLWERIRADLPDLEGQIRKGDFSDLLDWLGARVHQHGGKYDAQELVERITGSKIDPVPYLRYLESKFGAIYGL